MNIPRILPVFLSIILLVGGAWVVFHDTFRLNEADKHFIDSKIGQVNQEAENLVEDFNDQANTHNETLNRLIAELQRLNENLERIEKTQDEHAKQLIALIRNLEKKLNKFGMFLPD